MHDMRVAFLHQVAHRQQRQKRDTQALVGGPLEGREAIEAHLLLVAPYVPRSLAGRNDPDLMSASGQIGCQIMRHSRHPSHHRRILIRHNHNTHRLFIALYLQFRVQLFDPRTVFPFYVLYSEASEGVEAAVSAASAASASAASSAKI